MTPPTAPLQRLQAFRQKLLGIFPLRADALFELVDALLLTVDPRSPVELSASPAFRRRFSMVSDALRQGQVAPAAARELLDLKICPANQDWFRFGAFPPAGFFTVRLSGPS